MTMIMMMMMMMVMMMMMLSMMMIMMETFYFTENCEWGAARIAEAIRAYVRT